MTSLGRKARVAGLLYVLASVVGGVRLIYIPSVLIVHRDATATANNIAAHELLFRTGIVSYLVASTLFIFVVLALYRLLEGVDRPLAVVMVILGCLVQAPIFFVNTANDIAALLFARGADFLSAFDKPQHAALAALFLDLHHQLDLANSIFWGLWLLPFGLLVYRSGFLPRILGVWLMVACFSYLALSLTGLLAPQYEDTVWKYASPVNLGEVAMMLWLLIVGAREKSMAAAA